MLKLADLGLAVPDHFAELDDFLAVSVDRRLLLIDELLESGCAILVVITLRADCLQLAAQEFDLALEVEYDVVRALAFDVDRGDDKSRLRFVVMFDLVQLAGFIAQRMVAESGAAILESVLDCCYFKSHLSPFLPVVSPNE